MSQIIEIAKSVDISIKTAFIPSQSNENDEQFVYSYTITIQNNGLETIKLISRYWLITDANAEESVVSGEGVVGEQPVISAGESYTYTSGCLLKTPLGSMQGHYNMLTKDQDLIKVDIPVFSLAKPNILN